MPIWYAYIHMPNVNTKQFGLTPETTFTANVRKQFTNDPDLLVSQMLVDYYYNMQQTEASA